MNYTCILDFNSERERQRKRKRVFQNFFFWDRFSLCNPSWPETWYVGQAGLKLRLACSCLLDPGNKDALLHAWLQTTTTIHLKLFFIHDYSHIVFFLVRSMYVVSLLLSSLLSQLFWACSSRYSCIAKVTVGTCLNKFLQMELVG